MPALLQENNDFLSGLGAPMHAVKIARAVQVPNESNAKCSESLTYSSSVKNPGGCIVCRLLRRCCPHHFFWSSS